MNLFRQNGSLRNPCQCCGGSLPAPSAPQGQASSSAAHSGNWRSLSEGKSRQQSDMDFSKSLGQRQRTQILKSTCSFPHVPVLTISVPKGCINMTGDAFPLVHAARMDIFNPVLLKTEGPVRIGLEQVDFLDTIVFPLQSCLNIWNRKTQLPHWIRSCNLPLSIKHPVAVTCHRTKRYN